MFVFLKDVTCVLYLTIMNRSGGEYGIISLLSLYPINLPDIVKRLEQTNFFFIVTNAFYLTNEKA